MNHPEYQYLNTLKDIKENGTVCENRTGVNTRRILGVMHKYDFKDGFPLFTTKKTWFKGIAHELLWFLNGGTNIKYLVENGVNIWNDDAYRVYKQKLSEFYPDQEPCSKEWFIEHVLDEVLMRDYQYGDLNNVYGAQWRNWQWYDGVEMHSVDQVANLIEDLKDNPTSRRHILSAWNAPEIPFMGLPPCHLLSQYTVENNKLWCHMYQRSCDMFLGVPFNVASYSLLTYMLAQVCDLEPGGFIWTGHDCHVYENHLDAVNEQIQRTPTKFPELRLNPDKKNIDDFKYEDFELVGYNPQSPIKAKLNVG